MMFTCKSGKAFKVLNQHFETLHAIFFLVIFVIPTKIRFLIARNCRHIRVT
jgi:hypothetical protein